MQRQLGSFIGVGHRSFVHALYPGRGSGIHRVFVRKSVCWVLDSFTTRGLTVFGLVVGSAVSFWTLYVGVSHCCLFRNRRCCDVSA